MNILLIVCWSILGLLSLLAIGVWIFNRRPMRQTDQEHRELMRKMIPPRIESQGDKGVLRYDHIAGLWRWVKTGPYLNVITLNNGKFFVNRVRR